MIISVAYFIVYFTFFLILLALLVFHRSPLHACALPVQGLPRVSILIAARNEEHTILRCLQSIEALNYPPEKLEVLIGDDASTDATRAVIEEFIRNRPNHTCFSIQQQGKTQGKANVLAQLARHATTDYFLFTDADITVPPEWVNSMLASLKPGIGVVTGITVVSGPGFWAKLQAMDWLYALGLMQVVSELSLPVSTMGNNMLLRREAYESVGGYEGIAFSVTEDIAMFNALTRKGWGFKNLYIPEVLALSEPAPNVGQLLHQRKRWMRGSMHLPLYMAVIFILHAAYYPVLLPFFAYTSVGSALAVFAFKLLLQSLFIHICLRRLGMSASWWFYVFFELYLVVLSVALIIYFFLPVRISWKGRHYN
ncbi:glycosyltransferase [Pontibacter sp. CAU 1760]